MVVNIENVSSNTIYGQAGSKNNVISRQRSLEIDINCTIEIGKVQYVLSGARYTSDGESRCPES